MLMKIIIGTLKTNYNLSKPVKSLVMKPMSYLPLPTHVPVAEL